MFFNSANAESLTKGIKFGFIPDLHISFEQKNDWILRKESLVIFQDVARKLNSSSDIDFVVFGGDIVDNADKTLEHLPVFFDTLADFHKPYYVILGDRDADLAENYIKQDFTVEFRKNGFCEKDKTYWTVEKFDNLLLIGLDSSISGKFGGKIDCEQLNWLKNVLAQNKNKPTVIVMHHPPLINAVKLHPDKGFILENADEFLEVVKQNPQIKLVLSGHHHINSTMKIGNTVFITSPSIVTYPNAYKIITLYNDRVEIETPQISFKQIVKKAKNALITTDYAKKYDSMSPKSIIPFQEGGKFGKTNIIY